MRGKHRRCQCTNALRVCQVVGQLHEGSAALSLAFDSLATSTAWPCLHDRPCILPRRPFSWDIKSHARVGPKSFRNKATGTPTSLSHRPRPATTAQGSSARQCLHNLRLQGKNPDEPCSGHASACYQFLAGCTQSACRGSRQAAVWALPSCVACQLLPLCGRHSYFPLDLFWPQHRWAGFKLQSVETLCCPTLS